MQDGSLELACQASASPASHADAAAPAAAAHAPGVLVCILLALDERITPEMRATPSVFNSVSVPEISMYSYLQRLQGLIKCSSTAFICALVLVDRYLVRRECEGKEPNLLTRRNVHRLFLTCLVVAIKFNEDNIERNAHYAKAGGIRVGEMNRLELSLLTELDYDLRVQVDVYRRYEEALRFLGDLPRQTSDYACKSAEAVRNCIARANRRRQGQGHRSALLSTIGGLCYSACVPATGEAPRGGAPHREGQSIAPSTSAWNLLLDVLAFPRVGRQSRT